MRRVYGPAAPPGARVCALALVDQAAAAAAAAALAALAGRARPRDDGRLGKLEA